MTTHKSRRLTLADIRTLMEPTDVAAALGLTEKTLRNWRSLGTGPAHVYVGGRVRYRETDVVGWVNAQNKAS